jgi:hypothetical protein
VNISAGKKASRLNYEFYWVSEKRKSDDSSPVIGGAGNRNEPLLPLEQKQKAVTC